MIQLLSIVKKATCNFCSQRVEAGSDTRRWPGRGELHPRGCLFASRFHRNIWLALMTKARGETRRDVNYMRQIHHPCWFYVLLLQPVSLWDILWIETSHKIKPPGRQTWAQPRHSRLCCCSAGVRSNLSTRHACSAAKWFAESLRLEAPSDYSEAPPVVPATIFVIEVCKT